jgi:hypothetical protein
VGPKSVSYTATDPRGNATTAQCTSVTVVDQTPPTITCPATVVDGIADAQCQATIDPPPATAADNCDSVTSDPGPQPFSGVGIKPVNYGATDSSGNAGSATCNSVRVVDNTPPALTVPANQVVVGACSGAAVFTDQATATDNCGAVTPTCTKHSGDVLGFGTTTVTCTATDSSGNSTSKSYTVTVLEPLSLSFLPPVSSTAVNKFKVTQTIPHKVNLANCAGTDVTVSQAAGVTVRLGVSPNSSPGTNLINDVSDFTGVGDAGGTMYLTDGHFQYNLKTNTGEYASGGALYTSSVTVAYNDHPSITVGSKSATLQSK